MSDRSFLALHALRIKGFAKADALADLAGLDLETVETQLDERLSRGHAQFREARALWQLTAAGRSAHADELAHEVVGLDRETLAARYQPFLRLDKRLKELCEDWRDNDCASADIVERLSAFDSDAQQVVKGIGEVWPRLSMYASRLAQTCQRFASGETKMLTGVMCGSYHDVWMELHEDLILTQGIDRVEKGSI